MIQASNGEHHRRPSTSACSTRLTQANSNTVYKVLFMGRHGEGFHNAAESYYGTPSWNVRLFDYLKRQRKHLTTSSVLLVRTRRQQHNNLGRRGSHNSRHQTSPNCKRVLARPHRHPTRALPSILLHLAPNPLPENRKPDILGPRPPGRVSLRPHHQRTPPRRNLNSHLRPP
jgi:hypothetical protein